MKRTLLPLLMALVAIGCTSQQTTPKLVEYSIVVPGVDWDEEDEITEFQLNGKVKQVVHTLYEPKMHFGEIEADTPIAKYVCNFDENGKIVDFAVYDRNYGYYDGYYLEMELKVTFAYDENGNMTEKICYEEDAAGKFVYTYTNGKKSSFSMYEESGELLVELPYKYDSKNRLIEEPLFENMDYAFAKDLNLPPIDLEGAVKYGYGSNGELASIQFDYADEYGIDINYACKAGNDGGIVLEEKWSDGITAALHYYDKNRKLVRYETFDTNGILDGGCSVTYETMGGVQNVLNEKAILTGELLEYYTYEYDDNGNWTKSVNCYGESRLIGQN